MFLFIRNLVGVKADRAVNGAIEAIVRWDPKSATEAELRTMEQHLDQLGLQVAQARADLTRAERDMTRAEQQRTAAEQRAEGARQAAGLSVATSGLSVALKAMQDNAASNLAQAEAANAKAVLLRPSKPEQEDPNIAAAMAAVSGKSAPNASLGDRLATLRLRQ